MVIQAVVGEVRYLWWWFEKGDIEGSAVSYR
jgi:hypothetical protein